MATSETIVAIMRETADKLGCANFDVIAEPKNSDADRFTISWTGGRSRRITFSGCREQGSPTAQEVANATRKAFASMDEELVKPKVKSTAPLHDAIFGMRG